MIKSVFAFVATSALAVTLIQHFSGRQRRGEGRLHRDDVCRWEAEGGNLLAADAAGPGKVRRQQRPPRRR